MTIGIVPNVSSLNLNRVVNSARSAYFRTGRLRNNPTKRPTDLQEETERQERCARGDAWRLAKKIFMLKKEDKATFYPPSDEWVLPAASTIRPEEREFVVN